MRASHVPPAGDLAHNPGMCPDSESNQRYFGLQAGAQFTEPHQPGLTLLYCIVVSYVLPGTAVLWLCLDYNLLEIGTCFFLCLHSGRDLVCVYSLIMRDENSQVVG